MMSIYEIKGDPHAEDQTRKSRVTALDQFDDLDRWLENRDNKMITALARDVKEVNLLAFALDGLFWGRFDGEKWHKKSASTTWVEANVQEVRIFGDIGEVHLWRVAGGWIGRLITDGAGDDFTEMIDDQQLLWGDTVERHENGFTLLADGQQGLRHWLPIHIEQSELSRLRLRVCHYLADEDVARIAVSRLVGLGLSAEPKEENNEQ